MAQYKFSYLDSAGQTQYVDTDQDLRQTAGGAKFTLVSPTTPSVPTNPVKPVNPTTPVTSVNQTIPVKPVEQQINTNPTNQVSTGQNIRFRVNDVNSLTSLLKQSGVGQQEFEKNYVYKENGSYYLKPLALKLKTEGLVSKVNTPITSQVNIPSTLSQNQFNNLYSFQKENELSNKIAQAEASYQQAIQNAINLQAPSDTLRQDLYANTNFEALNKQLIDTDNALRNLEDNIRKQYAGREISESQLQALIAKESEPILRSRQYLADQVNSIKQQVAEQIADTYNAFSIKWQKAQGDVQLQKQYMTSLQNYANDLYTKERNKNLDYLSVLNFSLNLPEGQTVTLPDGSTIEGRKVNDNLSAQIETDSFGNATLVMFDKNAAANAIKNGKTPQITTVKLGQIGKGQSVDDQIKLLNANLTYDPNTGQLVQNINNATAEQIAEAIKIAEGGVSYDYSNPNRAEKGAYQFLPSTWEKFSNEYLQAIGQAPQSLNMSKENQDAVAQFKIQQWLDQGLTPDEIFSMWNHGSPNYKGVKGISTITGEPYDTEAYVNRGLNALRNIVAQSIVDKPVTEEQIKVETSLRKEFFGRDDIKNFIIVRDSYGRILASAEDPSPAGDLALIFNYMKVLDPGSTVREGEFATAQNAAGVPEIIRAKYNKVLNGKRLSNTQRKDFVDRSKKLYEMQLQNYIKVEQYFNSLAEYYKVDPNRITGGININFNQQSNQQNNQYPIGSVISYEGRIYQVIDDKGNLELIK